MRCRHEMEEKACRLGPSFRIGDYTRERIGFLKDRAETKWKELFTRGSAEVRVSSPAPPLPYLPLWGVKSLYSSVVERQSCQLRGFVSAGTRCEQEEEV